MPEYKDTLDDFNLKWGNSYVLLDDIPTYIHHAEYLDEEPPDYVVSGQTKEKKFHLENLDFDRIKPIVVGSCFVNVWPAAEQQKNKAYVVATKIERTGQRQNKRSFSDENMRISDPMRDVMQHFQSRWNKVFAPNWPIVLAALQPHYPSFQQALTTCQEYLAVALNPNFAITLSPYKDKPFLLKSLYGYIGYVEPGRIKVNHKASFQEVRDYVQRSGENLEVTLAG